MTLAAIAPFADGDVTIRNIGHIRFQECDRIHAILSNLHDLGIACEEKDGNVTIHPGTLHGALIHTYEDHRVAMAFAIIGLKTDHVIIENPSCCRKTFENYFETLEAQVYD